jgi:SAM-dependent methyltransferase
VSTELVAAEFNEGYANASIYDEMLPPHVYLGMEDDELAADILRNVLGPTQDVGTMRTIDIGAGSGRITKALAPYASTLHGTDKSPGMCARFAEVFPSARTTCADTETLLSKLHEGGGAGSYDLVGAFWSLSYPLLECFEETTAEGVVPADFERGLERAADIVSRLVGLLAPGGHLVLMFFDAESGEQRLVTKFWEQVSPFPGSGRGFTWELLRSGLERAERDGAGRLTVLRLPGYAICSNVQETVNWFNIGHMNSFKTLIEDPTVQADIRDFAERHTQMDGRVYLPSGVNIAHFHASNSVDVINRIL